MHILARQDPRRIGDYLVLGRLGAGAMGTVYLARSPGGRPVAVKVVRPELAGDAGFRERFRQEVATMRAVGGFWTAAVVDADPEADRPWLATEYVAGPTLTEAVTGHGPLPEPSVRRLAAGLAEALSAIHAAGLVHRDLKPSNVLLAEDGPRVIDFGIARALHGVGLTATGMLVGTPGFLSPEQIEGRAVTPASDVFALGSVLVYAATAVGPFGVGEAAALMYRAIHTAPGLDDVPAGLRELVARCLAARPESRPTPAELLAEIGSPTPAPWLPDRVHTMLAERRTEFAAPAAPARPATRRYTRVATPPPPVRPDPVPATPIRPDPAPAHQAAPAPASNRPDPVPAGQVAPPPAPTPPASRAGGGNRAVFRASRVSALLRGAAAGIGALICGSFSRAMAVAGHGAAALLLFAGLVLLAVPAIRLLWSLLRPRPWIEIAAAGLIVGRGKLRREWDWPRLARVRVLRDRRRPWLAVWFADPDAAAQLGAGFSRQHGGFRVFPVGHEYRGARREREVREVRAALTWYAPAVYDPSP